MEGRGGLDGPRGVPERPAGAEAELPRPGRRGARRRRLWPALLQRRRDTGQWAIPMGKQEFGETSRSARSARPAEETGVTTRSPAARHLLRPRPRRLHDSDGETARSTRSSCSGARSAGAGSQRRGERRRMVRARRTRRAGHPPDPVAAAAGLARRDRPAHRLSAPSRPGSARSKVLRQFVSGRADQRRPINGA